MQNRPLPYNQINRPFTPSGYAGYQGVGGANNARPMTVEELLSGQVPGAPAAMPDLAGAKTGASRQREIADMLMQGAQQQDNTSIAGGLSQLGQAWLARGARQKADAAEKDYSAMVQALTQKAVGGDEASIAALLSPEAAIQRKDTQGRNAVEDAFREKTFQRGVDEFDQTFGLQKDQFGWQKETDARDFTQGVNEFDKTFGLNQAQFKEGQRQFGLNYGLDARRVAAAEAEAAREAATGANRKTAEDQNGVLRYIDTGEPVFPGVEATAVTKPLIGAESMGRVAAGLPNMRQAVEDLKVALGVNFDGTTATTVEGGYRPGKDWGAMMLDQVPVVGDIMARNAGGEDYQKFDNAYASFEAAALPILSGAAVTDTEAKRTLKSLRVRVGDTDEAVARKMANMNRMVVGLEAAARGDTAALKAIVGEINSSGGDGLDDIPPGFVLVE